MTEYSLTLAKATSAALGLSKSVAIDVALAQPYTVLSIEDVESGPVVIAPVADFVGSVVSGNAPLTVNFTDLSANTPTSWAWNFGDATTSTSQNPTKIYTVPGVYTVTLVATNAAGSDTEVKASYIVAAFNPASLFTGGYTGGWYDRSDLSTLWQLTGGTLSFTPTLVTADSDPVGVILDKSQALALGADKVVNGDMSSATGWTQGVGVVIAGGLATFTAVGANLDSLYRDIGTNAANSGRLFKVVFDITAYTSGTIGIAIGGNPAVYFSGVGTHTCYIFHNGINTNLVFKCGAAGTTLTIDNASMKEVLGSHKRQIISAQRNAYKTTGGLFSTLSDGVDDNYTATPDGGSTTVFCYMACVKPTQVGVRQTLFSDVGTNTGYKVELNTSNQLVISAGNGTSYTSATTANTFSSGQVVSIEAYDDGTNIGVCLNNGTPVTAARPTVSAGSATFTLGKDNGASSGYFKGDVYGEIYTKNKANTPTERANAKTYLRAKGGI